MNPIKQGMILGTTLAMFFPACLSSQPTEKRPGRRGVDTLRIRIVSRGNGAADSEPGRTE